MTRQKRQTEWYEAYDAETIKDVILERIDTLSSIAGYRFSDEKRARIVSACVSRFNELVARHKGSKAAKDAYKNSVKAAVGTTSIEDKPRRLFTTKRCFQVNVQDLVMLAMPEKNGKNVAVKDYVLNDAGYYRNLVETYAAFDPEKLTLAMAKASPEMTFAQAEERATLMRQGGLQTNADLYAEALKRDDDEFGEMYVLPYKNMA